MTSVAGVIARSKLRKHSFGGVDERGIVGIGGRVGIDDGFKNGVGRFHVRLRWDHDLPVNIRLQHGRDQRGRRFIDSVVVFREPGSAVLANDRLRISFGS
jgi:hypothetical protein